MSLSSQLLCHVKEAGIQGFQVYFKIYSANLSDQIFSFVIEVHFIWNVLGLLYRTNPFQKVFCEEENKLEKFF